MFILHKYLLVKIFTHGGRLLKNGRKFLIKVGRIFQPYIALFTFEYFWSTIDPDSEKKTRSINIQKDMSLLSLPLAIPNTLQTGNISTCQRPVSLLLHRAFSCFLLESYSSIVVDLTQIVVALEYERAVVKWRRKQPRQWPRYKYELPRQLHVYLKWHYLLVYLKIELSHIN